MTDFLIVGPVTGRVFENTGYEEPPDLKGGVAAVDDNSLQNSERSPKRKFSCVLKIDPPSDLDVLLAAISVAGQIGVPTPVTVVSDVDGLTRGASLQMWVRAGRVQYKTKGAGIFKTTTVTVPLSFREA